MDIQDKNKKLIEAYFNQVWNQGNLELLDKIIAPHYVNHHPSAPNPLPGPVGLIPIIAGMRKGIPDLRYTIQNLVITEDKVVAHVRVQGTHRDTLWGIPPTGRSFDVEQINIERIEDGKIVEHWRVTEELKMFRQLGLV
jgi:steroid delta-isomerase-like uncharacterized protein